MDRRDGEEKENGLDHNQEKTDKQKGDGGAPLKGTEDPTYKDTRTPATRQDQLQGGEAGDTARGSEKQEPRLTERTRGPENSSRPTQDGD